MMIFDFLYGPDGCERVDGVYLAVPGTYVVLDQPRRVFGSGCIYYAEASISSHGVTEVGTSYDGFHVWRRREIDLAPGDEIVYRDAYDATGHIGQQQTGRTRITVRVCSEEHAQMLRKASEARRARAKRAAEARLAKLDRLAEDRRAEQREAQRARQEAWDATQDQNATEYRRAPRDWSPCVEVAS